MFELLELCVKLSILCVVLSVWLCGLILILALGFGEGLLTGGKSMGMLDLLRPWNGVCDGVLRML